MLHAWKHLLRASRGRTPPARELVAVRLRCSDLTSIRTDRPWSFAVTAYDCLLSRSERATVRMRSSPYCGPLPLARADPDIRLALPSRFEATKPARTGPRPPGGAPSPDRLPTRPASDLERPAGPNIEPFAEPEGHEASAVIQRVERRDSRPDPDDDGTLARS